LVDTARAKATEKRGAAQEVALEEVPERALLSNRMLQPNRALLAMEEALQKLEKEDPLKGQIIEMRFFGGMTAEESAVALGKPVHGVRRELRLANAWLRKEMVGDSNSYCLRDLA